MSTYTGPKAFRAGYAKMCEKYARDEARLTYIHELANDPDKHHFTKDFRFCNAVLTDVTEGLIFATKHWVYGPSKNSPSLFMAVVRMADGCNAMANKRYLDPRAKTKNMVKHQSAPVKCVCVKHECVSCSCAGSLILPNPNSFFFKRCAETLTRWATLEMFDTYNTHYNNYYVFDDQDAGTTTVTHRLHEDVHVIDKHFRCTIDTRRCWQQSYTGVLCIHSLMALISRICISPTDEAKESVCRLALGACHSNWHRTTYACFEDPKLLGGVPQIKEVVQSEKGDPDIW